MKIIPYSDKYKTAVLALHREGLKSFGSYIADHELRKKWDADLENIAETYIDNGGVFVLGIDKSNKLIAMGAVHNEGHRRAQLKRMRVEPEHQRQGLGSAMLAALLDFCQGKFDVVYLDTASSGAARRFYEKHGFKYVGPADSEVDYDGVIYELRLNSSE